jgi:hypothetical protein
MQYGKRTLLINQELIAVGDVHGEFDKLEVILAQIEKELKPTTHVVFCGDIINRGPDSIKCLLRLKEMNEKYPGQFFFILGNHEEMLLDYLKIDPPFYEKKYHDGQMMAVYGTLTFSEIEEMFDISLHTESVKRVLTEIGVIDFLMKFIPYYESEKVLVTHSPLDPTICSLYGLHKKTNDGSPYLFLDNMGSEIRWKFTDESFIIPEIKKFRICGHQTSYNRYPRIFKNRAFIDTGCGKGLYPLTALRYPSKKYFQAK